MTTRSADLLGQARAAYAASDWQQAATLVETWLGANAPNASAIRLLARAQQAQGLWSEAAASWSRLKALAPASPEAALNLARLAKRRGAWLEVHREAVAVLELEPEHAEALRLAVAAVEADSAVTASDEIWLLLARQDLSRLKLLVMELEAQGRHIDAARALAAARRTCPDDGDIARHCQHKADELLVRGRALEEVGEALRACEAYRGAAAVAEDPEPARARLSRIVRPLLADGGDYLKAKSWEAAAAAFAEVLRCDPDNVAALVGVGRIHEAAGHWHHAVEAWSRVIAIESDHDLARVRLGIGLEKQGRHAEAHRALLEIKSSEYAGRRDECLERLSQNAYKASRAAYVAEDYLAAAELLDVAQSVMGLSEAVTSLRERIARCLRREQRAAHAAKDVERTVRLGRRLIGDRSEDASVYTIQGRALSALQLHDEALAAWREAVRLDPQGNEAAIGLARAALAVGLYAEGNAAVSRVLERDPDNARAAEVLAKLALRAAKVA